MATSTSGAHAFTLPGVDDPIDEDLWGSQLNTNWENCDSYLSTRIANYDFAGYELIDALIVKPSEKKYDFASDISAGAVTLDYNNGTYQYATLTQNCEISFSNVPASQVWFMTIRITQDGTGGRAVTFNGAYTVQTEEQAPLAPTTTASSLVKYRVESEGGASTLFVSLNNDIG